LGGTARLDAGSVESLWNVEGTVLRAPSDPVISIDRVKHIVGETAEFTSVMKNVTGRGFQIVANVGAQLYHGELLGSDTPDQSILIKSTGQDELA
jgi:hypothetical protein